MSPAAGRPGDGMVAGDSGLQAAPQGTGTAVGSSSTVPGQPEWRRALTRAQQGTPQDTEQATHQTTEQATQQATGQRAPSCPSCGEALVRQPPKGWTRAWRGRLEYRHANSDSACPVPVVDRHYRPAAGGRR